MKVFFIIYNVFACVNAFIHRSQYHNQRVSFIRTITPQNSDPSPPHFPPPQETNIHSYLNLIRYKNIVPTAILCFTGGWIIDPNSLFHSRDFIVSTIETLVIMSNSMIINDIYDLRIDRINDTNKPLVTGEIKVKEAVVLFMFLLGFSEALSFYYLPENLQNIVNIANIWVSSYTFVFKPFPLVKNIACALIVSFSVFFSALAAYNDETVSIIHDRNFGLLCVVLNLIFYGSLSNEIILDIRDVIGDKANKVYTLPVIIGSKNAMLLSNLIILFNAVYNTRGFNYLYNDIWYGVPLWIVFGKLQINSMEIYKENFSEESIYTFLQKVNTSMITLLIYICVLAFVK